MFRQIPEYSRFPWFVATLALKAHDTEGSIQVPACKFKTVQHKCYNLNMVNNIYKQESTEIVSTSTKAKNIFSRDILTL